MQTSLKDLIEDAKNLDSAEILVIFSKLNLGLKDGIAKRKPFLGVDCILFARLVYQIALSFGDSHRLGSGSSTTNAPKWNILADKIQSFVDNLPEFVQDNCCSIISKTNLSQFASLATRKQGLGHKHYYSTIALFVCQFSQTDEFQSEYLKLVLTNEERNLPGRLFAAAKSLIDGTENDNTEKEAMDHPSFGVSLSFEVEQNHKSDVDSWVDSFSFGRDQCAHMILYRPMRKNPERLMKSFLAISPPKRLDHHKDSHAFTHVYNPPTRAGNTRLGYGKIIPLEHALYFVGGQRAKVDDKNPLGNRRPFSSMKIIAFNWTDIKARHSLIPGLAISTNYDGEVISSRIFGRITAFDESSMVDLKNFSANDLVKNLKKELKSERKHIEHCLDDSSEDRELWNLHNAERFIGSQNDEDLEELAQSILKGCNNNPASETGWQTPFGYVRPSEKGQSVLNRDLLTGELSQCLLSSEGESFTRDGQQFSLWTDIRFSPLNIGG